MAKNWDAKQRIAEAERILWLTAVLRYSERRKGRVAKNSDIYVGNLI